MNTALRIIAGLVVFVVAVNVIWYVAVPVLGDPGVYRPLFLILLIFLGSAVWRQVRRTGTP